MVTLMMMMMISTVTQPQRPTLYLWYVRALRLQYMTCVAFVFVQAIYATYIGL